MSDLKAKGLKNRAVEVGIERIEELSDTEDSEELDERAHAQAHVAQLLFTEARENQTVEGYQQLRSKIKRWPLTTALYREILGLESRLVWEKGHQKRYKLSFIKTFLSTYPGTYYESQATRYLHRINFYRETIKSGSLDAYKAYIKDPRADIVYLSEIRELLCCLLYTSPSPRDATLSRMPSSA